MELVNSFSGINIFLRLSEGPTRSWRTRYTSTGRCWVVSRCSHCRRAADIPCRDHRDQRSDPRPWGSERTAALRAPVAGGSLCVSFPTARSSASCLTQRKDDQGSHQRPSLPHGSSLHRILFSSLFLSFSSFCSTFRIMSLSCSSRKAKSSSSPSCSIISSV